MVGLPRPLRDGPLGALAGALGVSRVARITGLDRTGVEVATAVRPGAHVLQVTNGKGDAFEDAALGALLEAAELWAAERPAPGLVASAGELRARLGAAGFRRPSDASFAERKVPGRSSPAAQYGVLGPRELAGEDAPAEWEELRVAWIPATPIAGGGPVLVPAQAVHCPPPGGPPLGPAVLGWTSNGMGAHPDRAAALLHALLEAVERDRLARALPEGFTEGEIARRLVDPATLPAAAPRTAARVADLTRRGFGVHLLDVGEIGAGGSRSGPGLGLPVAAALLVDRYGGPVPVAAGYACRPARDAALSAALLEAAQSRATEIHGAREDVLHGDRDAAAPLAELCAAVRPTRSARSLPELRARSAATTVGLIARRLDAAGLGPALAVDLPSPPGVPVHVVKVIVPGLQLSDLL